MPSRTDSSQTLEILFDFCAVGFLAIIVWKESRGVTLASPQMLLAYGGFFISVGLAVGHSADVTPSAFSWERIIGGGFLLGLALFNNVILTHQQTLPGAIWWWVIAAVPVRFGYPLLVKRLNESALQA